MFQTFERTRRLVASLLLPILSACATTSPNATLPVIAPPAVWQQAPHDTAVVQSVPEQWWAQLNDPVLDRLIARAQQTAPDLRTAQLRLREARARRAQAGANTAPSVSASASASRSRSSGAAGPATTGNLFDAGFDASWEIDLFGRLQAGVDAAEADLGATQASLHDARVSLRAEVARNYIALRGYQVQLALARDNLALQSETQQIAQWRAQAGLVSTLDVEKASSNREQTRAQVFSLRSSLTQSQQQLELLIGLAPGALANQLQAAGALPALPQQLALTIPADMLRQRADVRAAGQQWQAEAARTAQARASLYPKLTLSGSIGLQSLTIGSLTDGGKGSLLAGLSAPIFDAGRLRAQLDTQAAVQDRFAVAYEKAVLTALSDVEGALAALAGSRGQTEALAASAVSAQQAAQLARQRYANGLIDFRTVLDAQRSLLTAQDSLATSQANGLYAWVRLYKALGGGVNASDDKINPEKTS